MYVKEIEYTDYRGQKRKETHRFNLTKAELVEMQNSHLGGMDVRMQRLTEAQDNRAIMAIFKDIIRKSYGVISDDGRRFIKSDELSDEFEQTEAYSIFVMELLNGYEEATKFVNEIIPKDVADEINKVSAISEGGSPVIPLAKPEN